MNRERWTVTDPKAGKERVFEEWPSARAEAVDLALTRDRRPIVITFPNGIRATLTAVYESAISEVLR